MCDCPRSGWCPKSGLGIVPVQYCTTDAWCRPHVVRASARFRRCTVTNAGKGPPTPYRRPHGFTLNVFRRLRPGLSQHERRLVFPTSADSAHARFSQPSTDARLSKVDSVDRRPISPIDDRLPVSTDARFRRTSCRRPQVSAHRRTHVTQQLAETWRCSHLYILR